MLSNIELWTVACLLIYGNKELLLIFKVASNLRIFVPLSVPPPYSKYGHSYPITYPTNPPHLPIYSSLKPAHPANFFAPPQPK